MIMPTLGIIMINFYFADDMYLTGEGKNAVIWITLISTFILPLAFIPFMLYQKLIETIELKTIRERMAPLLITSVFYFFSVYIMNKMNAPLIYTTFLLSAAISVFCAFLISLFFKISTHMTGIGGISGFIYTLLLYTETNMQLLLFASIFAAGFIAYARLRLNAHNAFQVYSGYLLGVAVSFLVFYIDRTEILLSM